MDVITALFEVITSAITNFLTAITSALNGVTSLFYVEPVGETPGHMTFIGVLLLIAVGVGIVYFAIRFIMGLVRRA